MTPKPRKCSFNQDKVEIPDTHGTSCFSALMACALLAEVAPLLRKKKESEPEGNPIEEI